MATAPIIVDRPLKLHNISTRVTTNKLVRFVDYSKKPHHCNDDIEGWEQNFNILSVDDNLINLRVCEFTLMDFGFNYMLVTNGQRCLEQYETGIFDLILMDIGMPHLNGYEITRIIRAREKISNIHLPIIALTAYGKDIAERCAEAGLDGVIGKPYTRADIYPVLKKYLLKK